MSDLRTEQQWLDCVDPRPMCRVVRGRASERKLQLLLCAGCRLVWHLFSDRETRSAVQLAEWHAEGLARREELLAARGNVARLCAARLGWREGEVAFMLSADDTWAPAFDDSANEVFARVATVAAAWLLWGGTVQHRGWDILCELAELEWWGSKVAPRQFCDVFRDVFGNPYRAAAVNPAWQTWNDRTAWRIAQGIYDERAFDRLPILADALEDAGCDNADILNHCRGDGPHVRGCWVLDLLLGKT